MTEAPRLMNVMAGGRFGGAETFFTRLAIALHQAGQPQLVATRGWPERAAELKAAGIEPAYVSFRGSLDLFSRWKLGRLIREFEPDVVLTWMNRATDFVRTRRSVHAARIGHYYNLRYYRHCDHLVCITPDLADYAIQGGFDRKQVHYIPNFFEPKPMPPVERTAFGTPQGVPLALAVGRLHRNKAFDVLLDAISTLPDLHLWIAGEGPSRAELEAQIERLGIGDRVRLLGWRDDIPALLGAADLMVVPSRSEGFGTVMIEGWSCRKPVVAAASEGPAGLIRDGRNGLLVPVDDAQALAKAMSAVVASPDLTAELVESAWDDYQETFTRPKVVGRYMEFIESVSRR
ncbi:MAG TPA: glycosyltransferase [Alphaproteobacteria bacterium]|nr:glycosyltransferase [Alphaproteobacteria bacterium]